MKPTILFRKGEKAMLEKVKEAIQADPVRTKKVAIAAGLIVGLSIASVVILNKGVELPWTDFDQIETLASENPLSE